MCKIDYVHLYELYLHCWRKWLEKKGLIKNKGPILHQWSWVSMNTRNRSSYVQGSCVGMESQPCVDKGHGRHTGSSGRQELVYGFAGKANLIPISAILWLSL